ncbi:sugar phosphate isomerase/epimerase [Thermostilla marina]
MRWAVCNETFQDRSLEEGFAFAAECGYRGIEIAPFTLAPLITDLSAARKAEIRKAIESAGLECVGLHWLLAKTEGFHVTTADADVRRRTAEYLGALARACAELGGRVLVFGSPQQRNIEPGMTYEQAVDHAVEVITAALPEFERANVVLALEPLGPEETNFLTTAEEAVRLIERIGSPNVRLHLDCKAMSTEPQPIPEVIRQNAQYLAHFHANDPNRQGPGFGEVDFVPIFQALREIDYRGWVSVEVFDYSPGIERLARDSLRYMQQCLAAVS